MNIKPTPKRNTAEELSTAAMSLLGHPRAALLTARDRDDLWGVATKVYPASAQWRTVVAIIADRLEGRSQVA
jgi:hypothetical protein